MLGLRELRPDRLRNGGSVRRPGILAHGSVRRLGVEAQEARSLGRDGRRVAISRDLLGSLLRRRGAAIAEVAGPDAPPWQLKFAARGAALRLIPPLHHRSLRHPRLDRRAVPGAVGDLPRATTGVGYVESDLRLHEIHRRSQRPTTVPQWLPDGAGRSCARKWDRGHRSWLFYAGSLARRRRASWECSMTRARSARRRSPSGAASRGLPPATALRERRDG